MSLFLIIASASTARAQTRYRVDALVHTGQRTVSTETTIEVGETQRAPLHLWLYADRLRHLPPSFDEFTAERIFVGEVSHGGYERIRVHVEGCPAVEHGASSQHNSDAVRGRIIPVRVCAEASMPVRIRVQSRMTLAHRYGTLGHARHTLSLGDPWYPLLLSADGKSPVDADHAVRIRFEDGKARDVVSPAGASHTSDAMLSQSSESHVPLFVLSSGFTRRAVVKGVDVTLITQRAPLALGRASRQDPSGYAHPFEPDAAQQIGQSVADAISTLRALGFVAASSPQPRHMASRITVVEIESRQRLAVALPGMVAVSDRAFRLFPLEQVERFHRMGIWRPVFATLLRPHLRAVESFEDRRWVPDAGASMLVDIALRRSDIARERPEDLIGFASFHPAVDQLLYAPQVPFENLYFARVREADPDRSGAQRALNTLPFGRLLYEKLRDRLPDRDTTPLLRDHLVSGRPLRSAAERATASPLGWFFRQWLGPERRVAYRIASVTSEPLPLGFRHTIAVDRLGDTSLRERVEVLVIDSAGNERHALWDAAGPTGTVEVVTPNALDDVHIDPNHRVEEDASLSDNHPRLDNRLRRPWRMPVFNSLNVTLSVHELEPDVFADFVIKPKHDVRRAIQVRFFGVPRGYGASARYRIGLGELRDLNSTVDEASTGVAVLRSDTGFAGSEQGVSEGLLTGSLGRDTRLQLYDPSVGHAVRIGAHVGVDRQDDGRSLLAAGLSTRGTVLLWPAVEHIVAFTAGAQLARCPALVQAMPSLAGRQYLRAYESDELLGCATAYGIIEERWSPIRGHFVNAANLAWGRRLQLVPFLAGGFVSSRGTAADLFRHFQAEAGLGIRILYDHAGIQPGMMAIDAAVPITTASRCEARDDRGACKEQRAPFGFHISFDQTL